MTETPKIDVGEGAAIPSRSDWGLFNAWVISIVGAVAAIIYLLLAHPDPYQRLLVYLSDGIVITFQVTVTSIICACVIGLITGLGRVSKNKAINLLRPPPTLKSSGAFRSWFSFSTFTTPLAGSSMCTTSPPPSSP